MINKNEIAEKLKAIAKRTIDIIDLLLEGKKDGEIIKEINCERSLVNYYRKRIYENKDKRNSK